MLEAKTVVLILTEAATKSPWVNREIIAAISERIPVLPFKIHNFELSKEFRLILGVIQWQDAYRGSIDNEIDRLVVRVEELLRAASVKAPVATPRAAIAIEQKPKQGVRPQVSPYVGPQPFPRQMAGKFFGRSHDASEILKLIAANRFVLIYAPSGAGKSSLLNTLVHDSLEEQGLEALLGARVGGALPQGVKAADIRNIFTFSVVYGLEGSTPNVQCRLSDSLQMRHIRPGVRGRVVIFDQFEELFTQHAERFEDRKGFFADVIDAMNADPGLRVVFAMRQEYLADIDPYLADLPDDFPFQRFALRRLTSRRRARGDRRAREAVRGLCRRRRRGDRPSIEHDSRRRVRWRGRREARRVHRDGSSADCVSTLWAALPAEIRQIEMQHVERAAGPGKSFGDFVVNALNAFYDDTVASVANSRATEEAGGYTKELIQLGCMKFVTTSATRTMIERKNDRTGRLPNWIVDQLEKSHLFRVETRGGSQWYELSHDRLADPVAKQLNRDVSKLLFASDLLATVLERVKEDRRTICWLLRVAP